MSESPRLASEAPSCLLGHSAAEDERLRQQPRQLASEAIWLLDQLSIQPGWRATDVGRGPQGVVDLLAERVGPGGRWSDSDEAGKMIEGWVVGKGDIKLALEALHATSAR